MVKQVKNVFNVKVHLNKRTGQGIVMLPKKNIVGKQMPKNVKLSW